MRSTHGWAWRLGLLALSVATVSAVSTRVFSDRKDATFSGTVPRESAAAHSFTLQETRQVEVRLTTLAPSPHATIGLGIGKPTSSGNCSLTSAEDHAPLDSKFVGVLPKGTYCVAVYDSGSLPQDEPTEYTVSVTEE